MNIMNIISARYANQEHTSVILKTENIGDVLVNALDVPQDILVEDFEVTLEEKIQWLDELRWQREQGGITVGGLPVMTRDRDKTLITGKITEALIKGTPDTDTFTFTLNGQDIVMSIGQLKAVGVAIAEHVQRTVDAAALVRPEIASGSLTTPEAVAAAFDAAYQSLT